MARNYNSYNYGTSPRKLEPEYTPSKKQKTNKPKAKKESNKIKEKEQQILKDQQRKKQQRKVKTYIGIGFIILLAISYRKSQIDEQFSKIQ